jgi:hypothetical protein
VVLDEMRDWTGHQLPPHVVYLATLVITGIRTLGAAE